MAVFFRAVAFSIVFAASVVISVAEIRPKGREDHKIQFGGGGTGKDVAVSATSCKKQGCFSAGGHDFRCDDGTVGYTLAQRQGGMSLTKNTHKCTPLNQYDTSDLSCGGTATKNGDCNNPANVDFYTDP